MIQTLRIFNKTIDPAAIPAAEDGGWISINSLIFGLTLFKINHKNQGTGLKSGLQALAW